MVLRRGSLSYAELVTVLCDAEVIINSRTLTYTNTSNTSHTSELVAVVPATF